MAQPQDSGDSAQAQAPDADDAQGSPEGQDGSGMGPVGQLIQGIHTDMQQLGDLVSKAGLPDQDVQLLSQAAQAFGQFVQALMQDAQGGGDQSQGQGQPPQAGSQAPTPQHAGKAKVQPANF